MNETVTPNRSKTYLLPLINEFLDLPYHLNHLFINTYVNDLENKYEDCFFLHYRYALKDPKFTKFEYELGKRNGYITHIDLKDNEVLYIFKFPEEFMYEYQMFKTGKYSRFRHDCKSLVLKYWNSKLSNATITKLKQIFDKSDILRKEMERTLKIKLTSDDELGEMMDETKETINIAEKAINYL